MFGGDYAKDRGVGTPKYEIPGQINDDCGLVRPGPVLPVDKRIEVG